MIFQVYERNNRVPLAMCWSNMGKIMIVHYVLSSNHGIHASILHAACGRIYIPILILISSTNNQRNYSLYEGIILATLLVDRSVKR